MESVSILAVLLVPAIAAWAAIVFIWPAVARARFVEVVSALRDGVDDAIIEGRLPDSPDVRGFLNKADVILEDPGHVSFSLLLAIHLTYEKHGARLTGKPLSYASLLPEQRKLMHDFDKQMVGALAAYIVRGSRFFVPFWCLSHIGRSSNGVRNQAQRVMSTPPPTQLASEFNRLPDPRTFLVS